LSRLPLGPELERGPRVTILLDGEPVEAFEGETVAAVLLARGRVETRRTVGGEPRGIFCGMGVCFDCLMVIDGIPNTRACMTWVREGLDVRSQVGLA
jgi:D-hydroxyproline dehydrogenase subunit gamma